MSLIYIDGPEKAGKTTLIKHMQEAVALDTLMIKWSGRDDSDGFGYEQMIRRALLDNKTVTIWDRGWMSETVYGKLLGQNRQLARQPFLSEWIYSRLMEGRGTRAILLPDDPARLAGLRDDTDLPVNPRDEYFLYKHFGLKYNYQVLYNGYTDYSVNRNTLSLYTAAIHMHQNSIFEYVGSMSPIVTFVADHAGQVPFNDTLWADVFEPFGNDAIQRFGYANLRTLADLPMHLKNNLVAVGEAARSELRDEVVWEMPDGDGAFSAAAYILKELTTL